MIKWLFIFLLTFSLQLIGQHDTLFLLNGGVKVAKIDTFDYDFVYYRNINKGGKVGKKRRKNLDHVFALKKERQPITYIYRQDSVIDNYFSIEQMEYYLKGRQQAKKYFRPYKTLLYGTALGTGVALYSLFPIKYGVKERYTEVLDTVTNRVYPVRVMNAQTLSPPIPFWEIIPIGAFAYYQGAAKKTKDFKSDDPELFKNEAFMIGYKESVIDRKVFASIGSSLGAYITTMLGYLVFDPVAD